MSRSQADIRSQQATITSKSYAPRCQLIHPQTKAVKEPPPPYKLRFRTVKYCHMDTSPQQLLQTSSNTSILYTTKLQIHRFKIRAVFTIAPSTYATFSLHRASAALLASMASWRALTSGMKSLLSRRNISRSTLPSEIELRRQSIRNERAEKFISAWQLVNPVVKPSNERQIRQACFDFIRLGAGTGLAPTQSELEEREVFLLEIRVFRQVHPQLLFNDCGPSHCSRRRWRAAGVRCLRLGEALESPLF